MTRIAAGRRVRLSYRLLDQRGELVEEVLETDPVTFVHGEDDLLPGLERAVEGLSAGDEVRVELAPEDAYGAYDPGGLVSVPRNELPPEPAPEKGDWVVVSVERDDDEPDELDVRVVEVSDDEVLLDANHPLAGQRVTFVVRVLSVDDAGDDAGQERDSR